MSHKNLYDYQCEKCKVVEEVLAPWDEKEEPVCPKCGKGKMKRIPSAPLWKWAAGCRGF